VFRVFVPEKLAPASFNHGGCDLGCFDLGHGLDSKPAMSETKRESAPKEDDVLRTLLNTPPDPRVKKAKPKKRKKAAK
jgi:hypothetical protein